MKKQTIEEQLAEFDAETAKKRAAIVQEDALERFLPDWAQAVTHTILYGSRLYGSSLSMKWDRQRYSSLDRGEQNPTLELVGRLMGQFPPVPIMLVDQGCKSFQPTAHAETNPEEKLTAVAPFIIEIGEYLGWEAKFRWFAQIGEELARMEVVLPLPVGLLGSPIVHIKRDPDGDIKKIEQCDYNPRPAGARRIKWASGSHKTLNMFTVYWESPDYTFAELVAN